MNKIIANYYKPTPKKLRQFGDSLLAISAFVTGYGAYSDNDAIILIAFLSGIVGKFLTNFYSEENGK